jgi:threonine synthase
MDVGNPSNAARVEALYAGRHADLRADVIGESVDDRATYDTIRKTYETTGRLVCPHTAVGLAARRRHPEARRALVLATAHPGKFAEIVREATGADVEMPPVLQHALESQRQPTDLPADIDALRRFLRAL